MTNTKYLFSVRTRRDYALKGEKTRRQAKTQNQDNQHRQKTPNIKGKKKTSPIFPSPNPNQSAIHPSIHIIPSVGPQ